MRALASPSTSPRRRAVGADQAQGMGPRSETASACGAASTSVIEPLPPKVAAWAAARPRSRAATSDRTAWSFVTRPLGTQPRSGDVAAQHGEQRRLAARPILRDCAIARSRARRGRRIAHAVGAGHGPDHIDQFQSLAEIAVGGVGEIGDIAPPPSRTAAGSPLKACPTVPISVKSR